MNNTSRLPIGASIMHYLAFSPIIAVYFFFELLKAVITELHRAVVPVFILVFLGGNWIVPIVSDLPNMTYFITIFKQDEWTAFIKGAFGANYVNTGFELVLLSIIMIIFITAMYVLPAILAALFVSYTVKDMNERFLWDEREQYFYSLFIQLKNNSAKTYALNRGRYYKNRSIKAIINVVCFVVVIFLLMVLVGAIRG